MADAAKIIFTEGDAPLAPASGQSTIYAKTDHKFYRKDSTGTELEFGASGDVSTDVIWDAAGDLVVGTGANTAIKLTKGTEGKVLTAGAETLSWETISISLSTQTPESILANATENTAVPSAMPIAEQTIVGRVTGRHVEDLSAGQVRALLNVADGATNYAHPTGDGNLHVPANSTTNSGKVLTAGAVAGVTTWETAATGGDVATDTLWDAAGDLVIGTGSNTAGKLTKGSEGKVLTAGATTLSWETPSAIGLATSISDGDTTHAPDGDTVFHALAGKQATGLSPLNSQAIAENDFLVGAATPFGSWAKKTLAETKTVLGLGSAAYTDSTAYDTAGTAAGKIASSISDGDTTHAPDGNSVFDALALKAPLSGATLTGATVNALTPTALATGFTIAGGTTSKTLTVPLDASVSGTNTGDYTHPTGDGNLHVPANSTTNSGKVLTAGSDAGTYTWQTPSGSSLSRLNKTHADTPYTVTAGNCSGSVVFTNTGATAEVVMNLHAGADGYRVNAIITAAYDFTFRANGTETIRYLSTVSIAGGSIKSASIGDELQLDWNGTQWVASVLGLSSWWLETS